VAVQHDRAPAVVVDGAAKTYRIPREQRHTLKERILHPFHRIEHRTLEALKEISFSVQPGEFFGIVGRNGSGKSTLLKCLAGIYRLDAGAVYIDGRVSTFIELGVGFNPDLAARDNIILNATMLGLSRAESRKRADRVIKFAELEEFAELKLKNYSSGMHVRLAFSVMIQVDADVLLIDEVLAVGDAAFQQKCFEVFQRLRDEGKTIVFVTHDMGAVQRFCHRAMLLERGEMVAIGGPERVGNRYLEINFDHQVPEDEGEEEEERYGDGTAEIVEAWFEDDRGHRAEQLRQGELCTFKARVRANVALEDPVVAVLLEDEQHHPLFAISNEDGKVDTGVHRAGDEAMFSVRFENVIAPGRVFASPWVLRNGATAILDRRPRLVSVIVTSVRPSGGLVDLPAEVGYERVDAGVPQGAGA